MYPSSVSICIHGLLLGHITYRQSRDTLTSDGRDRDGCVMLRRWLISGSCIQILSLKRSAMPKEISCELMRIVELSIVWSLTSYPPNTTHLNQRELANSVITHAADIEAMPYG